MKARFLDDNEDIVLEDGQDVKLACCDCGLVHRIVARVDDDKIRLSMYDDRRSTGQMRRYIHNIALWILDDLVKKFIGAKK